MADIAKIGFEVDSGPLDRANKALRVMAGLGRPVKSAVGGIAKAVKRTAAGLARMAKSIFSLRGAIAALGVGFLIKSFIDVSRETENLQVRLVALTGSTEDATKAFEIMQTFAGRVPFSFREIQQSGAILLTVTDDVDDLSKVLEITGDIAAATGLSFQETASQIQRSFAAGIGAADLFRDKGVSALLGFQAGATITAEETRAKILSMWDEGVTNNLRGGAQAMASTWDGVMSMLGDRWFSFRQSLMSSGLFDFMKASLTALLEFIDMNFGSIQEAGEAAGIFIKDTIIDIVIIGAKMMDVISNIVSFIKIGIDAISFLIKPLVDAMKLMGTVAGAIFDAARGDVTTFEESTKATLSRITALMEQFKDLKLPSVGAGGDKPDKGDGVSTDSNREKSLKTLDKIRQDNLKAFDDQLALLDLREQAQLEHIETLALTEEEALEARVTTEQTFNELRRQTMEEEQQTIESMAADHLERMAEMEMNNQARTLAVWQSGWQGKADIIGGIMGSMTVLMDTNSKKLFAIGKAAAIAETVIATIRAAQSSYAFGANIGGPLLGAAMAAVATISGIARVQQIKAQSFGGGSSVSANAGGGVSTSNTGTTSPTTQQLPIAAPVPTPTQTVNLRLIGSAFTAESIRDEVIPLLNQASEDGVPIKINVETDEAG